MPAKHAFNVSVTEHLSRFVVAQVASGRFGTVSEVVRAALRLLEQDQNHSLPVQREERVTEGIGLTHGITARVRAKRTAKPSTTP
jgi:putative addiction module CopG family antidote